MVELSYLRTWTSYVYNYAYSSYYLLLHSLDHQFSCCHFMACNSWPPWPFSCTFALFIIHYHFLPETSSVYYLHLIQHDLMCPALLRFALFLGIRTSSDLSKLWACINCMLMHALSSYVILFMSQAYAAILL